MFRSALSLSVLLSVCALPATAQEWTRFRGPNGTGVCEAPKLPVTWTDQDYAWKVELPGTGASSPVIWGERLFVASANDKTGARMLTAYQTSDGKQLWNREFESATHKKHKKNTFASGTPAVDAKHVYFCWGTPTEYLLVALDHDGKEVWRYDLGPFRGGHGQGSSPIVFEDMVVLGNDQEGESYLLALDAATGKVRWKLSRKSKQSTYSTPCVYQPKGQDPQLIFSSWELGITGVDARTGAQLWEYDGFDLSKGRAISSPVVYRDTIIATCGFYTDKKAALAVRPGQLAGSKPATVEEVYRLERAVPHIPSPIVYKDRLYLWADNGIVSCHRAADGEQVWQERIGGNYFSSPVCISGRLYGLSEDGEVVVLATGDEFQQLGTTDLGEPSRSTPAVAGGTLYLRTMTHLMALKGKP